MSKSREGTVVVVVMVEVSSDRVVRTERISLKKTEETMEEKVHAGTSQSVTTILHFILDLTV